MKKVILVALLLSIFVGNFSTLAQANDGVGSKDVLQTSAPKTVSDKNMTSGENVTNNPELANKLLKNVLLSCGALVVAALSFYGTYKIGYKVAKNNQVVPNNGGGLGKNIKDSLSCVNKSKVLKKLLIGGAITGTIMGTATIIALCFYSKELLAVPIFLFFLLRSILTGRSLPH